MSWSKHSRRTVLKGAGLGMSARLLSGLAPAGASEPQKYGPMNIGQIKTA
jgi:hypothetical protein